MEVCDIRRRNSGGNVVEVGVETVCPRGEIDLCALSGDLDQAVGLITCERASFSRTAKHNNRTVDRCSLRLMPSPAIQESAEDWQANPGDRAGT